MKHGQYSAGGPNKSRNKSKISDEYTSEFPALDKGKPSDSKAVSTIESSTVNETSDSNCSQPLKSLSAEQEKKPVTTTTANTSRYRATSPRATKYVNSSTNRNYHQEQLNGGSPSSSHNKNFFNRPSTNSPIEKEYNTQVNQENSSTGMGQDRDSNYYNRRPQQHSGNHTHNHSFKQHYNSPGAQGNKQHHQFSSSSSPRGRNFHQHYNNQQQYNRDRYFAKGSGPPSLSNNSNQQHYDQQHHNVTHTTAGTGRTQHSGGHFHHYNNQHCMYFNTTFYLYIYI